jgi:hypothetical protein
MIKGLPAVTWAGIRLLRTYPIDSFKHNH